MQVLDYLSFSCDTMGTSHMLCYCYPSHQVLYLGHTDTARRSVCVPTLTKLKTKIRKLYFLCGGDGSNGADGGADGHGGDDGG